MNMQHIVDEYVAVWNEPDPQTRRRRIRSVWAPDGTTCYRLMDARGAEAIEVRVAQSWDKWLKESKYVFRPQHFVCHHDAIKLQFVLVKAAGGAVEANGVCYLLLNPDGRIRHDYQFNPSANEPNALIDRYLAALNEPDPGVRRERAAELWAPDARRLSEGRWPTDAMPLKPGSGTCTTGARPAASPTCRPACRKNITNWSGSSGSCRPGTARQSPRPARIC